MSGYWSAIAAAARGGAGGQESAVPVPSAPTFAPDVNGDAEDWGAVDIEAAAPATTGPREVSQGERTAPAVSVADAPAGAPEPVAPAGSPIPATPLSAAEAPAIRDDDRQAGTPPAADERAAWVAVTEATAVVVAEQAIAPPPDVIQPPPAAFAAAGPARPETEFPAIAAADKYGGDEIAPEAVVAEPAPVVIVAEALPVAAVATADIAAPGDMDGDAVADLPPPVHIHIDRIDIRLTGEDAVAPRAAPRRAAPVVALDEFLRRPSERNG